MNNVSLVGRIGQELELKSTPSGQKVLNFPLAVSRAYVNKGEERKTDWLDCVAWGVTAEFISKYFHKGQNIAIVGEIQTDNYTDRDGKNRKSFKIMVRNCFFCEGRAEAREKAAEAPIEVDDLEDSLPF